MIFQLIYESTATQSFSRAELVDLLTVSRRNNAREEITGLLLYHQGRFLQLLEGAQEKVLRLFKIIAEDQRHHWVSVMMTGPSAARDFPDWTMAFRDLPGEASRRGWSDFLDNPADAKLRAAPSYVRDIFHRFRDAAGLDVTG